MIGTPGYPNPLISGRCAFPKYLGRCRCGCVFHVHDAGGTDTSAGLPMAHCPECHRFTLLDKRHEEGK